LQSADKGRTGTTAAARQPAGEFLRLYSAHFEGNRKASMKRFLKSLWQDESGVAAVEYALIAGLMAALIVLVVGLFGDSLKDLFNALSDKLGEQADNIRQK
jgi:pilus assembly protein Flp/PilA